MAARSGYKNLNWRDVGRSFIMAALMILLPALYTLFGEDHWPTWVEFIPILQGAVRAGTGYIILNYFTNDCGQIAKQDSTNCDTDKDVDKDK